MYRRDTEVDTVDDNEDGVMNSANNRAPSGAIGRRRQAAHQEDFTFCLRTKISGFVTCSVCQRPFVNRECHNISVRI